MNYGVGAAAYKEGIARYLSEDGTGD